MAEKVKEGDTFYSERHNLWGTVLPGGSVAAMVDNEVPAVFKHLDRVPSDAKQVGVEFPASNVNLDYVRVLNICKYLVFRAVPVESLVDFTQ